MEDYKGLGSQKPLPLFSSQHLIWSLSVTFSGGGGGTQTKKPCTDEREYGYYFLEPQILFSQF